MKHTITMKSHKLKIVPTGWLTLTPTERVKEGDFWTARSNVTDHQSPEKYEQYNQLFSTLTDEQLKAEELLPGGWMPVSDYHYGSNPKDYSALITIRRRQPKTKPN